MIFFTKHHYNCISHFYSIDHMGKIHRRPGLFPIVLTLAGTCRPCVLLQLRVRRYHGLKINKHDPGLRWNKIIFFKTYITWHVDNFFIYGNMIGCWIISVCPPFWVHLNQNKNLEVEKYPYPNARARKYWHSTLRRWKQ